MGISIKRKLAFVLLLSLLLSSSAFSRTTTTAEGSKGRTFTTAAAPAHCMAAHRVGRISLAVNNNGTFGKGFRAGYAVFWRLVAIGLLFALVVLTPLIVLIAMVAGLIITKHYWAAAGTGIPFFLIWLAITIYAGVVAVFAARFVVDRGAGAFESIGRAHGLIMRCKGETTLVWLLSVALGIGTGTAYLLVFLLFFLPLIFITPSLYHSSGLATAVIFGAIFGLIALAVILLITGLLTVFQSAYWTLAYLELAKKEAPANVPLLQEPQMGTSAG